MDDIDEREIAQQRVVESHRPLPIHQYQRDAVCLFPPERSVPAEYIRRLTDELVHGGSDVLADRSYETVRVRKGGGGGEVRTARVLTRLERFVDAHAGWSDLCHTHLRRLASEATGVEMVLYKEKLNLKPPGGSGYAPHLDAPSLRVAFGDDGPLTFCTVMVAIDDMTEANGCLQVCRGEWSEHRRVGTVGPADDGGDDDDGDPDAGGRAGAVRPDVADALAFEPLPCEGGTVAVFSGWAPHRSAANASRSPRRAVFLTYNPKEEGDYHVRYYERMIELRRAWRESAERRSREDACSELLALSTIPKR
jgi:ectoine hydroxylase-related dioxygenase (phytanoyl-CoA dioxygenase family)